MLTKEDLMAVIKLLENAGITYWLDGGWSVDILAGKQTFVLNEDGTSKQAILIPEKISEYSFPLKAELLAKIAPCSLLCHTCGAYKNGVICKSAKQLLKYMDGVKEFYEKHSPSQAENHGIFLQSLEHYGAGMCSGCREKEHHSCCIKGCFIQECTKKHSVDFCGECTEFPCRRTMTLFEEEVYRQWLAGSQEIQKNGIEKYWEKNCRKPHYREYK